MKKKFIYNSFKSLIIILTLLPIFVFSNTNNSVFVNIDKSNSVNNHQEIINTILLKNISNKNDFNFFVKKVQKGLSNVKYYHYGYKYKNILVDNKSIVISVKNDKAFLMSGKFDIPKIDSLNEVNNSNIVFKNFMNNTNKIKFHSKIEKVLIVQNGITYLTYKALIEYTKNKKYYLGIIYLDTLTSEKILFKSHIYDALNREVYSFNNRCLEDDDDYWALPKVCGARTPCTGDLLFYETNPNEEDITALHAYNNTGITYWFYKHMLNRDSFNNAGKTLVSTVHVKYYQEGYGCHGQNASFMGAPFYQMIYGDGRAGDLTDDFARALDVVAHELTHAVTDSTSNLIYQDESGALNEAMSDIFGATVEAWSNSGGSATGNPLEFNYDENTWKIGEDIGRVMRYMNNPYLVGDPDHYTLKIGGFGDNGGVHTNSSIINLAYYLIVVGGNHPRKLFQGLVPDIQGLGLKKTIKIFYEAQVGLFTASTNFTDARMLLSQAAENLYGVCSNESEQVNKAFDILGVPGTRREECGSTCEELDCSGDSNSFCDESFGQAYCKCNDGFHLNHDMTFCEEDYICYYVTCELQNSHCEEFQDNGVCVCDEGYYLDGQACLKEKVDPCENVDCDDHGTCVIENDIPSCNCSPGYENGENELTCIKYENPCNDITCSGHGNCIVKNNEALCGCFDGYHVSETNHLECIEDEVDLCENVSCSNHGVCAVVDDKATCICEANYEAQNLECIEKQEPTNIDDSKGDSSSCTYNSTPNSSYLFMIFALILLVTRKSKKLN